MRRHKYVHFRLRGAVSTIIPGQRDRLRGFLHSGTVAGMTQKKIIVLDPDASFERASRHLHKCRKCRNAGMEWARRKKLCRVGRQLLEDLERIERIYEGTELAA